MDEAGRGPLAGPVVAAAVILPEPTSARVADLPFPLDSKLFPAPRREELFSSVTASAIAWSVGVATVEEIDELNILQATLLAMRRAVTALPHAIQLLLVDGTRVPPGLPFPARPIVHGDRLSLSIGAASIVAKVTRDRMMDDLHREYPLYGFDRHRGYGTPAHQEALRLHGPCPCHRRSFRGVRPPS